MSYGGDSYGDQQYRGNYGASGPDFSDLARHAEQHYGLASSYFNEAANHLQQNHGNLQSQDIDEGHAVESHKKLYGDSSSSGPVDSNELGAGAALQALKKFTGGGGGGGGGGVNQNQLIGLAIAEAEKLFDQHSANGNASGDKQSAINAAAEMAFKMYAKGQGNGLGGTGGPSGLLGLASKFF